MRRAYAPNVTYSSVELARFRRRNDTNCMTIGLVDDDAAVRRGLTRLLAACGHRIETYGSASQFLQEAALDSFDCLLLVVRMPELTGFDLFERLARRGCTVPIISSPATATPPLGSTPCGEARLRG